MHPRASRRLRSKLPERTGPLPLGKPTQPVCHPIISLSMSFMPRDTAERDFFLWSSFLEAHLGLSLFEVQRQVSESLYVFILYSAITKNRKTGDCFKRPHFFYRYEQANAVLKIGSAAQAKSGMVICMWSCAHPYPGSPPRPFVDKSAYVMRSDL
jgi:hypothetical protein